ncbi:hypothetical protein SADUNF_Sadunf06G0138300 [Salix dunnii]|uniref:Uncharacterized protein n=1 Tax=Salix dunnii TaxID=1413687 RepID=A0A835JZ52_9ROSI|nr:hypothetical protein SADUNF_Sadunf06G0138300 [Salix dunnii]
MVIPITGTYIVWEGDPAEDIMESSTTNGGGTGFLNSIKLKPGDFCGEELDAWALHPKSPLNIHPDIIHIIGRHGQPASYWLLCVGVKEG